MKTRVWNRRAAAIVVIGLWLAGFSSKPAVAIPSFNSPDWRLPNPDRPYEMTSGTVLYHAPPYFAVYDLEFQPSDPSQLDHPSRRHDGRYEFDSTFDITYHAIVSTGAAPPHQISGHGNAHAIGITRPDPHANFTFSNPQVFDTELVSLNLFGLSPIPEVMLRESPTQKSMGVIIREDPCPMCLAPFTHWIISSFFDIFTEFTPNGSTWTPANSAIHVEQAPDGFSPGDYNHDKVVDAGDYVVWRNTLGERGAGLAADGDWSGMVDHGDLDVWRHHFGQTTHGSAPHVAVPEPSLWALSSIAAATASMRLRRKRASLVHVE